MKPSTLVLLVTLGFSLSLLLSVWGGGSSRAASSESVKLPDPRLDSDTSVEEALKTRRSVRSYKDAALSMEHVSQLLWAAQGITNPRGFRTAPSAGALYPLEVYAVVGNVQGLPPGVYQYRPRGHALSPAAEGDRRKDLARAALRQNWIADSPLVFVFSGVYERTTGKYGRRGVRYVHMEAGHAAQNVYLQSVSLGLGTVVVGAFDDDAVRQLLGMGDNEEPLYIMPVGEKRE